MWGVCTTECPDPGLGAVSSGGWERGRRLSGWAGPGMGEALCGAQDLPRGPGGQDGRTSLEELVQHREPKALQQCLRKVRLQGRVLTAGTGLAEEAAVLLSQKRGLALVLSISLWPSHLPRLWSNSLHPWEGCSGC